MAADAEANVPRSDRTTDRGDVIHALCCAKCGLATWSPDGLPALCTLCAKDRPAPPTTVAFANPALMREVLFSGLYCGVRDVEKLLRDETYNIKRGKVGRAAQKSIREKLARADECLMLLEQVGWR